MKRRTHKWDAYYAAFQPASALRLLRSGGEYFECLLDAIAEAKKSIHLHTYIFEMDQTGRRVSTALMEAVGRGVEVSVVIDGFGSLNFPQATCNAWRQAGIQVKQFSRISLFSNLHIGRRLHHKVFVADGERAIVGGINVADKYHGEKGQIPWLDFALYVEGSVAEKLEHICRQVEAPWFTLRNYREPPRYHGQQIAQVNVRQNDWLRNRKQIYFSYLMALDSAEHSICLFASYFLPGKRLRNAFERAAARGVRIRIVLAGKSDIPRAVNASLYLYDWLQRTGIEVYEWKPSVLHAKLAMVDDEWMTVGSFNLNQLSTYGSIELNLDVLDPLFVSSRRKDIDHLIYEGCMRIVPGARKSLPARIQLYVAYIAGRTLLWLITFFPNFSHKSGRPVD
jgi:cardiolipin synthase